MCIRDRFYVKCSVFFLRYIMTRTYDESIEFISYVSHGSLNSKPSQFFGPPPVNSLVWKNRLHLPRNWTHPPQLHTPHFSVNAFSSLTLQPRLPLSVEHIFKCPESVTIKTSLHIPHDHIAVLSEFFFPCLASPVPSPSKIPLPHLNPPTVLKALTTSH